MTGAKGQTLPSKEANLFRQVVKCYESKQYKKGIKAADQVLKKFPDHGETLAMKGLIVGFSDKAETKAEAYELVRKGLKANLQSHVCWHVYGLLWRADNNYDEAMKCYKNALRFDKENLQILRDLSQLQIQLREYAGYIETRQTLLQLKSSNRHNWISLAVAHHLNKEYDTAVNILKGYEGVQEGVPPGEEYEYSEMMLYKALILEEAGKCTEALQCMGASKDQLKDPLGHKEAKARLLVRLGRQAEAATTLRQLLAINPDNHKYHSGLREVLGLLPSPSGEWSERQQKELQSLYEGLVQDFPKSTTPPRMQLDFLEGEAFELALERFVRRFLVKGIPSLFSELKGLYSSPAKVKVIQSTMEKILEALEADPEKLPPLSGESEGQNAGEALLWTRLFLARHFDRLGQTDRSLELLQLCKEQDSGVLEVYMAKGIILKHAGDLEGAAVACYTAQSLDPADRFLNGAASKALFRAGHIARAERMAWLFIQAADPAQTLNDMQCMWYQIESGLAHLRKQGYGRALKNFLAVVKHFAVFKEDQFDFHTYCMRKTTLRNYVNMLRMEDTILENPNYAKAAFGAVETYLKLADKGPLEEQSLEEEEAMLASLSLEERKKHKLKKKKDAQKKAKEEDKRKSAAAAAIAEAAAKSKEQSKGGNKNKGEKAAAKDPDPDGAELASTSNPLEEAAKLLVPLREHAGGRLRTHTLSFEVALRRKKHLLALQAVNQGLTLVTAEHPEVHRMIVLLGREVLTPSSTAQNGHAKEKAPLPAETVSKVLKSHLDKIFDGKTVQDYHQSYVQKHGQSSLAAKAVIAELNIVLKLEGKKAALEALVDAGSRSQGAEALQGHAEAIAVHKLLKERLAASEAAEAWKQSCSQRYPYSLYFGGEKSTPASVLDNLYEEAEKAKSKKPNSKQ